jgi:hypothetical protein
MTVSPQRVAARYLSAANARLTPKAKSATNAALIRAGMDGNGRFESPGKALGKASEVLAANGLEWGEVINSLPLRQPKGRMNIGIAMSNPDDPFSPTDISSSALAIQWYQLDGGAYEVVAYLS